MIKFLAYFKTIKKLGFLNVFRVLIHRTNIKSGYYKLIMPIKDCPVPDEIVLEKKEKLLASQKN